MYWEVPRGTNYGEKVMRKFKYTIKEEQGIHARPASFLIQEARTYESRITLRVKGKEADASNIIAVMALDVMCGQKVEVNTKMPEELRRVPFRNMIYVADGPSDIPAFSLVNKNQGATFAIYPHGDMEAMR